MDKFAFPSMSVSECIHPGVAACLAGLFLLYPIRIQPVHPIVQIVLCASLTTIGVSEAIAFAFCPSDACSSCQQWVLYITAIFSLVTVVVPAIGAIIGLGVSAGLLADAIYPNTYWVALATMGGLASMFVYRVLLLHWQLIAPPIIGGFFAASSVESLVSMPVQFAVWILCAISSLALHIRRRRANTWLEQKQNQALYSEESQIVQVMRHSNPTMSVDEFEKMKVRLLQVVEGDNEQADRIVYGGGLY